MKGLRRKVSGILHSNAAPLESRSLWVVANLIWLSAQAPHGSIQRRLTLRLKALALIVAIMSLPLAMQATPITYTYTGPSFTGYFGPYNGSDSISGSFTVAGPLADNLTSLTTINPVSFSFSDGVNTISNTSYNISDYFQVETDANGGLTGYSISVQDGPGGYSGLNQIVITSGYSEAIDDQYEYTYYNTYTVPYTYSCGFLGESTCTGYNTYSVPEVGTTDVGVGFTGSSGSFTNDAIAATPEPSSLMLLATGALSFVGAVRKRIR